MQDCYVGDIGDFGKYGLLRWLCGMFDDAPSLSLGVLWYRTPDGNKGEGGNTNYLHAPLRERYEHCDSDLFTIMRSIVCFGERKIVTIEESIVLPSGTAYFSECLSFDGMKPGATRADKRQSWIDAGFEAVRDADIIFADPDTGLEVKSKSKLTIEGPKYAYYKDLIPYWNSGKSLVIYQHSARTKRTPFDQQINGRMAELHSKFAGSPWVFALRFKERAYFVVPQPDQADLLNKRARSFVAPDSPWRKHFELHTYPS